MPDNRLNCLRWLFLFSILLMGWRAADAQSAKNFLEIPVKLEVEKGDLNDVVVKVRKDGSDAFTQSGASKMRFKLDFGKKYTLIFTKPGYITKTIELNTYAPSTRISQGFEPYKIGVKLFKQNDEKNMVVYNQPVARIKYDQNLDEFNFDTDYSKSILSAMQGGKKANKDQPTETGVTPDTEPESGAESKPTATASPSAGSTTLASTENTPLSNEALQPSGSSQPVIQPAESPKPTSEPLSGQDAAAKTPVIAAEEKHQAPQLASGEERKQLKGVIIGEEQAKKAPVQAGEEKASLASSTGDSEQLNKKATMQSGADDPAAKRGLISGEDVAESNAGFAESEKITREEIVEKNKVIIKVKVTRGNKTTEYSCVQYAWGGRFFFKDNATSISENYFAQNTGTGL